MPISIRAAIPGLGGLVGISPAIELLAGLFI